MKYLVWSIPIKTVEPDGSRKYKTVEQALKVKEKLESLDEVVVFYVERDKEANGVYYQKPTTT